MKTPVQDSSSPTSSAEELRSTESVTLWKTTWRRLFKRKSAIAGLIILGTLIAIAVLAPVLAPYNPKETLIGKEPIKMRQAPCIHLLGCPKDQIQHLMGIDGNGRDQFSRVLFGAR